ncbi:MAG: aromatic amino acid lyase [Gemmatimonadales bacterium]|nr:MAG: aromatic amino acid lyase [Gemmatimonadales bacterium]
MNAFRLGMDPLTPEALWTLAELQSPLCVLESPVLDRLVQGRRALDEELEADQAVYGANTAYGGDAVGVLSAHERAGLQLHLARYLDAGVGPPLPPRACRAAVIARAHVLAQGASAVSPQAVTALVRLIGAQVAPVLLSSGSLGASGDLVSMAPLARLLAGEDVPAWQGESRVSGPEALSAAGVEPLELVGRDALALVNGLSGAASCAALSWTEADRLLRWALVGVAATGWALGVRAEAWSEVMNGPPLRRHPGQEEVARLLRGRLRGSEPIAPPASGPLQDPYSLRCAPQLLGPVREGHEVAGRWLFQELDGVSDNPIWVSDDTPWWRDFRADAPEVDAPGEGSHPSPFLSGGNFFGGYVAAAADLVSAGLARVGDLLDRQGFLLVAGDRGLPRNLATPGVPGSHGLKGVHQTATALAMELQRGALPSAPFARSAEGHNQDVVSNAMAAATALGRQVGAAAALVSAHTLMAARAVELRSNVGDGFGAWLDQVRDAMGGVSGDKGYSAALAGLAHHIRRCPPP